MSSAFPPDHPHNLQEWDKRTLLEMSHRQTRLQKLIDQWKRVDTLTDNQFLRLCFKTFEELGWGCNCLKQNAPTKQEAERDQTLFVRSGGFDAQ